MTDMREFRKVVMGVLEDNNIKQPRDVVPKSALAKVCGSVFTRWRNQGLTNEN